MSLIKFVGKLVSDAREISRLEKRLSEVEFSLNNLARVRQNGWLKTGDVESRQAFLQAEHKSIVSHLRTYGIRASEWKGG